MSNQTVTWSGYDFTVYPPSTTWNDVGGIYIFSGTNHQGKWVAYYIGQAESFQTRLPSHERWNDAVRLGATHIHAMPVSTESERQRIEAELIHNFQPQLNTQLR